MVQALPQIELLPAGLASPVRSAFTTRLGGVSSAPWSSLNLGVHVEDEWRRVHANRELVRCALGADDVVFAQQVHGGEVAVVERASARSRERGVAGVDALVTRVPGVALAVLAADCLPVLLADPDAGVVAASHAGRRGLVAGVLQRTVEVMLSLGAQPAKITAVIGPGACGRCYELPPPMVDEVGRQVPGSRSTTRVGTAGVDLTAGATAVLAGLGIADVQAVSGCTIEQPERFYSYRRDGRTGRHAGLVMLQHAA